MSHPTTQLQLTNTWGACPPDGYRYVDPVSGFLAHAWTYVDWIDAQKAHLIANKREIPATLEADMQNQLCSTLPPGWCLYDDDNRPRPTTSLTWDSVVNGVKTFKRWIAGGMKYVHQKEADRRALICSRCYLNVNVQGCSGCQEIVNEVVGEQHTKHDAALRSCAVCKCFLKAKVHFPIETLDTQSEKVQSMYPGFCWLNKESENYRG
jgi:hypothetical protein